MEPDKFEKHIKNQMREREISPSANAWNKISNQLPAQEPKSKSFFWYSVAAAFIGILILSSLYFNTSDEVIEPNIQVVETPNEPADIPKTEAVLAEQNTTEEKITIVDKTSIKKAENSSGQFETDLNPKAQIASAGNDGDIVKRVGTVPTGTERLINTKIAEIVAQVNLLENNSLPVSSMEVDSLLRQAQQEILSNKIFNDKCEVDAMALLSEVEGELDKSFREQIFESLKTGFLKVRTAVADRNN
ncbi:MAG: hypothetical protein KJO52_10700 [Maribacter sp.]|nr:hypothetical protein [Maribacter sp.]